MPPRAILLLVLFITSVYSLPIFSNSSNPFPPSNYLSYVNQFCLSSDECANGAMICINSTCQFCSTEYICELEPLFICSNTYLWNNTTVGLCQLKPLYPFTWNDIVSSAICFVGGAVAASAGIGGGGIFNPSFLLTKYPLSLSIPFSTVIIFGASIANFMFFVCSTHPKSKARPLIDYHFTLLTLPILLSGAIVGIQFNSVLPNWSIVLILFVALMFAGYKSIQKGVQITKKLKQQAKQVKLEQANEEDIVESTVEIELQDEVTDATSVEAQHSEILENTVFPTADTSNVEIQNSPVVEETLVATNETMTETDEIPKETLLEEEQKLTSNDALAVQEYKLESQIQKKTFVDHFLRVDASRFPIHLWIPLLVIWCLISVMSFLRGSKSSPSVLGIIPCSWQYWLILAIQFPVLIAATLVIGVIFKFIDSLKQKRGFVWLEGQLKYNTWNRALGIPLLFFFIGMMGSLVGLGGGMFASPVLLSMGQDPSVVVATSALMVLFSAAISVVQFMLIGRLPWDYACWFFVLGLVSGILGQFAIGYIIKRYNKSHWIVFIIAGVIIVSATATTALGVYQTVMDALNQKPMGFKTLCT